MSNPIIIGLTGGIGSGKSIVSKVLSSIGIPVYDSDTAAKSLYHEDSVLQKELKTRFGPDIFVNGQLNTRELARLVFGNEQSLKDLNAMVHPRVKQHFEQWLFTHRSHSLLVKEAAILIESGAHKSCDYIWMVRAPENLRIQRVIERDRVTEEEVKARLARQWSDEKREPFVDRIIDNDEHELLLPQIWEAIQSTKSQAQ